MSILEGIRSHYAIFGPYGLWLLSKARLARRPIVVEALVVGIKHPVYLRLRTTDVSLFSEIILVLGEYNFELARAPKVIIDAGANIGLTSVFFANKYPSAKIIAIEPELSNYKMLQRNVACYPSVTAVHGALWNENQDIRICDSGTGQWGFQTFRADEHTVRPKESYVRGIRLDKLIEDCGLGCVDILKIDIEGSEKEVFESSAPWIDKVGVIMVELHDQLRPRLQPRCIFNHQRLRD